MDNLHMPRSLGHATRKANVDNGQQQEGRLRKPTSERAEFKEKGGDDK